MDVDFAFICDYADSGRKVNALGIGFDATYASRVLATHPRFDLAAQVRYHVTEAGPKDFAVRLIDADGEDIIPPIQDTLSCATRHVCAPRPAKRCWLVPAGKPQRQAGRKARVLPGLRLNPPSASLTAVAETWGWSPAHSGPTGLRWKRIRAPGPLRWLRCALPAQVRWWDVADPDTIDGR